MRSASVAAAALLTLAACVAVGSTAGQVTVDDIKCEVCDYATAAWVRYAIAADVACRAANNGETPDAQLLSVLPYSTVDGNVALFDAKSSCESGHVSNAGVGMFANPLCKEFVLDAFPYVEEFPATGERELDRFRMWEDEPGYFERSAADEGVQPMSAKQIDVVRQACERTLPVSSPQKRPPFVAAIRAAVAQAELADLEAKLMATLRTEFAAIEAEAEEKAVAGANEHDNNGAAASAAAVRRFLAIEKRQAVYRVILAMQKEFCATSCDSGILRPPTERRVRGWSASLRRL